MQDVPCKVTHGQTDDSAVEEHAKQHIHVHAPSQCPWPMSTPVKQSTACLPLIPFIELLCMLKQGIHGRQQGFFQQCPLWSQLLWSSLIGLRGATPWLRRQGELLLVWNHFTFVSWPAWCLQASYPSLLTRKAVFLISHAMFVGPIRHSIIMSCDKTALSVWFEQRYSGVVQSKHQVQCSRSASSTVRWCGYAMWAYVSVLDKATGCCQRTLEDLQVLKMGCRKVGSQTAPE